MELKFGSRVITRDGESVGKIEEMVFGHSNHVLHHLVVEEGMFQGTERIVPFAEFVGVDTDGEVMISRGSGSVDNLQEVVDADDMRSIDVERGGVGVDDPIVAAVPMQTQVVAAPIVTGDAGARMHARTEDALDASVGNLADAVVVTKSTEVHGSDDKKVGNVDEAVIDDKGGLQGVVVRAGFIFKHDIYVPAESFRNFSGERIDITLTSDEAAEWRRNT